MIREPTPRNSAYRDVVAQTFECQSLMTTIGARLGSIDPGRVVVQCPIRDDHLQQTGALHAGLISTLADTACGCAALTLAEPGLDVVSIEFKLNLLEPGRGQSVEAVGEVIRIGRTLAVTQASVHAIDDHDTRRHIAQMQATMMLIKAR